MKYKENAILLQDYRQAILRSSAFRGPHDPQEVCDAINEELELRRQVLTRMQK